MPQPTPEVLLSAWEQGRAERLPIGRSLALLGVMAPYPASVRLADLRIGQRDALLLQLYEKVFGDVFCAIALCEGCHASVEFSFLGSELRSTECVQQQDKQQICWEQYDIEFRMPTSRDLVTVSESEEIAVQRAQLIERIVLSVKWGGQPVGVEALPEEVISAIEAQLQNADELAEVNLRLHCESCGHEWSALFDVGTFLWKKVDAWALRLLQEVHLLARAYGWREEDIIGMTPWRRHAYLEMQGA